MRIFTTLIAFLLLSYTAAAQVVLVNSPGGLAGSYDFSAAAFGADLTSGLWTADVAFVDDGSALPTQGCGAAINGADLAGKIALIDRGTCEFGVKCLNAETAGAIAVVVFNSLPNAGLGTIVMGAGAVGATVTLPAVMLSYDDGQIIRAAVAAGTVNMTIGNLQFPNDVRVTRESILNAVNGVMPADQAEALGYTVTPGAAVQNRGLNVATGVGVQATIEYTPFGGSTGTPVYDEYDVASSLPVDSSVLIVLPDYTPTEGAGVYSLNYITTLDSADDASTDNAVATEFMLSNNIYCKGRWDLTNNRPRTTNSYTISGGGNIEFLAGFEVPIGIGNKVDSIQFLVTTNAPSLGSLGASDINAFVYEWDDLNGDDILTNNEFSIVGFSPVEIQDTSATSEWVKTEVLDYLEFEPSYVIPDDDRRYFVGVRYEGALLVFFGFDEPYDQTIAVDSGFITRDIDLPYIGVNAYNGLLPNVETGTFLFTGVRASVATALYINQVESPSVELTPSVVSINLLPNPVSTQLIAETELQTTTQSIEYTIRDAAGRLVLNTRRTVNGNYDKAEFDVSQFPAGQYFIVVRTDDVTKAKRFTVQR
ncbi:MAG: T9SS type A sorting domain-containing protein [Bacteroidetes bacterium]|nr:T9SS type A sorting domain-containing protein [Bacteroidota bacterium]